MRETPWTPLRMDYEGVLSCVVLGAIVETYSVYSVYALRAWNPSENIH